MHSLINGIDVPGAKHTRVAYRGVKQIYYVCRWELEYGSSVALVSLPSWLWVSGVDRNIVGAVKTRR